MDIEFFDEVFQKPGTVENFLISGKEKARLACSIMPFFGGGRKAI